MALAPWGPMRKTKKRTLILSLASAAAGFALPGCGDSSETNTTSPEGSFVTPPGSVVAPYDAPITTGSFIVPPDAGDAGDAGEGDAPRMLGSVVRPADAGDAPEFPGLVINPNDGSASG